MASEALELAWLNHEFSKYLFDIHRYELARYHAKKARDMGQEADSEQWVLNSNHLTLRVEINQNNRNEAREAAFLALSGAKKLGIDFLVDFYKRAIYIVEDLDVEKVMDFDAIAVRQQLILDLMPIDMKTTVDFLWRRMDAVPAKRRLSAMPGCKPVDRKFNVAFKRMTILPSAYKDTEKANRKEFLKRYEPKRTRSGFLDSEDFQ